MRRKVKNILKVLVILVVTILSMMRISIAVTTGTIISDTVRVRKEPTTKSSIVGLASIGDKVQVIEKSGEWYKITCEYEGKQVTGYVRGDLIDVKDSEKVSTKETNNTADSQPTSNSNEEEENDKTTDKSEENPNNSTEEPTEQPEESNEQDKNITSEVNNSDKKTEEEQENQSETVLTTLKIQKNQIKENATITLTNDLDIKILPVVNSTNIATIKQGTQVTIIESINQWVRIETEEQIGWARIEQ